MAAHVETSNFSSGYAWAKCSECGWKGQKQIGAGKLSNDQARKEAAAHDAEHHAEPAPAFRPGQMVAAKNGRGGVYMIARVIPSNGFIPATYELDNGSVDIRKRGLSGRHPVAKIDRYYKALA
ncbi:hypothetical protein SEA_NIOBE_59 [Arthrobacter phage Niobe]|uniref:Uncharacterized protein n=1 Tax=Arthrobacter phage Elezi TaxID=2762410 RepID=A0A7G8LH36_9CAUD|nr:hypothetical protein PQE13_gp58 [Arthrobacter phage Elezi]QNJ56558.1 hypothetical protein SEA_ELEZI_58 [Arthrobacter phage Elezi]QOP64362.1 hypothetical protein SEA_LONDON_59 [Arthrobacter phage London]UAJ15420.1 hypothetical protein SEA_ASA16_59 [Arthrobacter phage Asa16]